LLFQAFGLKNAEILMGNGPRKLSCTHLNKGTAAGFLIWCGYVRLGAI